MRARTYVMTGGVAIAGLTAVAFGRHVRRTIEDARIMLDMLGLNQGGNTLRIGLAEGRLRLISAVVAANHRVKLAYISRQGWFVITCWDRDGQKIPLPAALTNGPITMSNLETHLSSDS